MPSAPPCEGLARSAAEAPPESGNELLPVPENGPAPPVGAEPGCGPANGPGCGPANGPGCGPANGPGCGPANGPGPLAGKPGCGKPGWVGPGWVGPGWAGLTRSRPLSRS